MAIKYAIRIYDTSGNLQYEFTSQDWITLKFDIVYNDIGTFACVFGQKHVEWLTANLMLPDGLDYFVDILRLHPVTNNAEVEHTYFLRVSNPFEDNTGRYFMIGGVSLNHLLLRRVIDPQDDSRASGGYVTDAGVASDLIRDLVVEHLGNGAKSARQITNFSVQSDGSGQQAGGRWRYDNLYKICDELATKGLVQFEITRQSSNSLLFRVGTLYSDKTVGTNYNLSEYVLFERLRGNITDPSLLLDFQEQQNFVYARGSGNDDNETILELQGDGVTDSPYNRIEFSVSAKRDDGSDSLYLLTSAVKGLSDNLPQIEFSFPVLERAGAQYRKDWSLGDLISVQWGTYQRDLRIIAVDFDVQGEGDSIGVKVENVIT